MKKIYLSILILGFSLLGFSQDKVYDEPNFSTFPPTGWTVLNDQGTSGTTFNWKQSNFPLILSDALANQEEWIISPTIVCTAGNNYRVSFDYLTSVYNADVNVYLLMSLDNGITWTPAPFTSPTGKVWTKGAATEDVWFNQSVQINEAAGNSIKFAVVFYTTAPVTDGYFAFDNVLVEEQVGADPYTVFKNYKFETGITAANWTTVNTPAPGSSEHFSNRWLAMVDDDPGLSQDEWLKTKDYIISDNALTTVKLDIGWYALLNSDGISTELKISTDHGVSFSTIHNLSASTNWLQDFSYNLDAYKGDTVMFAINFINTSTATTNFFLTSFKVSQVFKVSSVSADALITLAALDTMIYPVLDKYNAGDLTGPDAGKGIKEGFWQVSPEDWTLTQTAKATWGKITTSSETHDSYAHIDTADLKKTAMNETITSQIINLKYPSVGASYELSFEWRTETDRNCGLNTDPNLGEGAQYDFADAIVEIRTSTNGTTWTGWTKIWQEDDNTILDATTSKDNTSGYFTAWTNFEDYLNLNGFGTSTPNWYKATLNITQYAVGNKNIQVRFNYKSGTNVDQSGYFDLDNFYILRNQNPQFAVETSVPVSFSNTYHLDYTSIPLSQISNPVKLGARITSYGIKTFDNANLTFVVNDGSGDKTYGYRTIKPADFTVWPSTKYLEADNRAVEFATGINLASGKTYTVTASGTINNSLTPYTSTQTFAIDPVIYSKYVNWTVPVDTVTKADTISGGRGSVFEIKVKEKIDKVLVRLGNVTSGSEFYMTVIELASPDAGSGTLVFTSPRQAAVTGDNTFNSDFTLEPGFYAFMFNQTDKNDLEIGADTDARKGRIVRGNSSSLYYYAEEKCELMVQISVAPNTDPEIVTKFTNNKQAVVAGLPASIKFTATDKDGDALTWPSDLASRSVTPKWLGEWMTFTDGGDGTLTIGGTPSSEYLGVSEVLLTVKDARNATTTYKFDLEVLSETAFMTPDFIEPFDGTDGDIPLLWITRDDYSNTESTVSWRLSSNTSYIYGQSKDQDEWLISPPIYIPAKTASSDSTYRLEFDWKVESFNNFCGGTAGTLGSSKVVNGTTTYNNADVTLMVSTDQGATWSVPIWQEDSPTLVPPVTKGIFGGKNWIYEDDYYTSIISLSAYTGKKVMFAFRYQSKNATGTDEAFSIDNFKVLLNEEVDLSVYARTAYDRIPGQHVDMTKGITFDAYIVNKGWSLPAGATYTIQCAENGYFSTGNLDAAFFASGDVQKVSYTFIPDTGIYKTYTFDVKVTEDKNTTADLESHSINASLDASAYSKIVLDSREVKTFAAYDGIGVIYELTQTDDLNYIHAYFGNVSSDTPYNISVIKLAAKDATSGELIATIDDDLGTALTVNANTSVYIYPKYDQSIGKSLRLQPGFYAIMFNQLDEVKPLSIYCTDNTFDSKEFIRGNHKKLYNESDDRGSIYTYLVFENNTSPYFVSGTVQDETIYAGQLFTRKVTAKDDNPYGTVDVEALTLPSWITMTSNGGGIYTLTGTPTSLLSGTHNILLQASDGFNKTDDVTDPDAADGLIILTVKTNPAPEFTTTPPTEAHQGVAFEYTALASDMFNEAITITASLLPSWLTTTASAGSIVLSGTPGTTNLGNNVVKLLATDASGVTSQQIFNINVFSNAVPAFLSWPGLTANAGSVYTYQVLCSDDNAGSVLTIASATTLPTWLTLASTGNGAATLTGTPTTGGKFDISLNVTDPVGALSTQSFSITVIANAAPLISSTAIVEGSEDVLYEYNVTATDADGNYLTFETPLLPTWLTFTVTGNGKARLQGVPRQSNVGNSLVTVKVSDGVSSATQSFTIAVAEVNDAPAIKSDTKGTVTEGELFSMVVEATDDENAPLTFSAVLPTWLTLLDNKNGTALISGIPTALQVGDILLSVSVSDGSLSTEQVIGLTIKGVYKEVTEPVTPEINLYPNPSKGIFTLDKVDGYKVLVFNSAGVVVLQVENALINQKIDLSNYGSGTYIVKVMSKNSVISTRQITIVN